MAENMNHWASVKYDTPKGSETPKLEQENTYFTFNSHPKTALDRAFDEYRNEAEKRNNEIRNTRILDVKGVTNEKLENLKKHISNITIMSANIDFARSQIRDILSGPEHIHENIDLQFGDKMIWNQESQSLLISSQQGKVKFLIRMAPYTPAEQRQVDAIRPQESHEKLANPGKILGDWLARRGPWPGKNNSCGASCGNLLNNFWLKSVLPQSGRDGKNWDSILERSPANQYFNKIPVSHPNDAPAGSILVFNENAALGSSARKKYGHAEIKWSDGMFYSYYKSVNAWWSSKTSEKNPQKYQQLTGFTGYAYVYNGKKLPG